MFPNNVNRKYRTRYQSVTLKAIWNDFSGREVSTKKYASSNIFSNSNSDVIVQQLKHIKDDIKVHKFKISGVFVPYEKAGTSSEESDFGSTSKQPVEKPKIEKYPKIQDEIPIEINQQRVHNSTNASDRNSRNAVTQVSQNAAGYQQNSNDEENSVNQQIEISQDDSDNMLPKPRKKLLKPYEQLQQQQQESKNLQRRQGQADQEGQLSNQPQPQQQVFSLEDQNQQQQQKNLKQQLPQSLPSLDKETRKSLQIQIQEQQVIHMKQQQKTPFMHPECNFTPQEYLSPISRVFPPLEKPPVHAPVVVSEEEQLLLKQQQQLLLQEQQKLQEAEQEQELQKRREEFELFQQENSNATSVFTIGVKETNDMFNNNNGHTSAAVTTAAMKLPSSLLVTSDTQLNEKQEAGIVARLLEKQKRDKSEITTESTVPQSTQDAIQSERDRSNNTILTPQPQQQQQKKDASENVSLRTSMIEGEESENDFILELNSPQKLLGLKDQPNNNNNVSNTPNNNNSTSQARLRSLASVESNIKRPNRQATESDVIFAEKLFQSSGHTLQTLFQERLLKASDKNVSKYSFITSENDIVFEASEELLVNMSTKDELCLATFFLPITVVYDPATDTITDSLVETSLYYHFINAYPSLKWVGVIHNTHHFSAAIQQRVMVQLVSKYRFYPIFIEEELLDSFLNHFCANMYDEIMRNQFNVINFKPMEFNSKIVEEVQMVSFRFAQQMSRMIDEDTSVMIADSRIIFSIIYLCQCRPQKLNIAYFHDSQFPDLEKLALLPFGEKLINAILCANLISFTTFEAAHNFLRYVRLKLKLAYESVRGNLRLIYMGNQIIIHIRNPGVNTRQIANIKNSAGFQETVNAIKKDIMNNGNDIEGQEGFLIVGIDTLHKHHQIPLKLKLFERFIRNHPLIKIQLIQIILPDPYDYSEDVNNGFGNEELKIQIDTIAKDISYGSFDQNPLKIIYGSMGLKDRLAYLSLADVFLRTSLEQSSDIFSLEYVLSSSKKGFSFVSKFGSQQYKQLRSCMTFNPASYAEFEKNILEIMDLPITLREKVLVKDIELLNQFSTGIWIEKTIAELKKNAKFMSQANMTGFSKGVNFKKVAHQANFKKFNIYDGSSLYAKTVRRVIILGFVGTLVPFDKYMYIQAEEHQVRRHHQKPSDKVIESLKNICADKRNMVYIVTELSIDFMDEWFADVPGLGLICENGYLHKVIQENSKTTNEWVRLAEFDLTWRPFVYRIMESFAVRTQGSSVEVKECSVVWKYSKVSIDFGSRQAEQMVIQLRQALAPLKFLEVSHSGESVEVRPTNLNKGIVVELLIERKILECGKIDFILIIGSSTSDEDMFCACQMLFRNRKFQDTRLRPLYVTIGVKPSNAYYYMPFEDVEKVLELLEISEAFVPSS